MAEKIRGITLEIGGDTKKLTASLNDVDKQLKTTQGGLNDVNRLLKFSPSSTVLLTQKQQLLADAVDQTSERLKELEKIQDAMDSNGIDKNSKQYQALQREIVETESKLKNLKKQASDFGSVFSQQIKNASNEAKKLGESVKEAGEKVSGIGEKMAPVAAGIAGAGVAFNMFADSAQTASNKVAAATGATADEMQSLEDVISGIYKNNYGEGFDDIAEAIIKVKQNLDGLDDASLQEVTESAIALRDTFDYDISESTRAAKALMQNFGVSADDAFNLIVQGAQNGLDYSGELLDNISEYSVQFSKLGLDATDMFNIFVSGAENGAFNLDKIGDAVKELSIRVVDGSDTTAEGFKLLGLNADEMAAKFAAGGDSAKEAFNQVVDGLGSMTDPIDQNLAGVDLFGTMWEDLGPQVVTSLNEVTGAIDTAQPALEDLKNVRYDDLKNDLSELGRTAVDEVAVPLGEQLIPVAKSMLDVASGLINTFASMPTSVQNTILVIGGLIAVFTVLISTVGSIISGVGTMITVFGVLLSPIGLVVAAIAALIAIGVALAANWDTVKQVAGDVWNSIKDFASNCWAGITGLWNGLVSFFSGVWNGAKSAASNAWNSIKDFASSAWNGIVGIWNGVTGFFGGVFDGIKSKAQSIWDGVTGIFEGAINTIKGLFNFKFEWPKIPLPHFSITGSANPLDWITQGVPKLSVQWYRKAENHEAYFDNPAIIGVGDVPEVVIGRKRWDEMKARAEGTGKTTNVVNNMTIIQQPGESNEDLANRIEKKIAFKAEREDKVWA